MNFLMYLLLGSLVYTAGFVINLKILRPKRPKNVQYSWKEPIVLKFVMACFIVMLVVSMLLSLYVLKHQTLDMAYVAINSLVATVVFYFGLNPDEQNLKLPD